MSFLDTRIIIVTICLTICHSYKKHDMLELVIDKIRQTIKYYEKNYSKMNLDGVFGLRILEGQIVNIKDHLQKLNPTFLDHPLISRLEMIKNQANFLANSSLKYLERENPAYFNHLSWIIVNPWVYGSTKFYDIYLKNKTIFDKATIVPEDDDIEEVSDDCISSMTKKSNKCHLSQSCVKFITKKESAGYELTHQLLNMMIVHIVNCSEQVNIQLNALDTRLSLSGLQHELCIKNFFEVSTIIAKHNGDIPVFFRDLFLEELMVCPMLGYYQFLHEQWLHIMLSWQKESGCWPELPFIFQTLQKELGSLHTGRQLLYEKVLPDGCSSHMTSVASGCLAVFLRYLILCEMYDACGIHIPKINYLLSPHLLPYEPVTVPGFQTIIPSIICIVLLFFLALILYYFFRKRILRFCTRVRWVYHI